MNTVQMERQAYDNLTKVLVWLALMPEGLELGRSFDEHLMEVVDELTYDILNEDPDRFSFCNPSCVDGQLFVERWNNMTGACVKCLIEPVDL